MVATPRCAMAMAATRDSPSPLRASRSVVRNVIDALAKGGYLVVGPTEGIYMMLDSLKGARRLEGEGRDATVVRLPGSPGN